MLTSSNLFLIFVDIISLVFFSFLQPTKYPKVLLGVFIEKPTPFLEEFFGRLLDMNYPKSKIDLYVHAHLKASFYYIVNV